MRIVAVEHRVDELGDRVFTVIRQLGVVAMAVGVDGVARSARNQSGTALRIAREDAAKSSGHVVSAGVFGLLRIERRCFGESTVFGVHGQAGELGLGGGKTELAGDDPVVEQGHVARRPRPLRQERDVLIGGKTRRDGFGPTVPMFSGHNGHVCGG